MRLTTIILITAIMQVNASSFAQKITLSERNAPLSKVFDKILEQSGVEFIVSDNMLKEARLVNIQVSNVELNEVLRQIFENQNLQFVMQDKSVIVSRKLSGLLNNIAGYLAQKDISGRVLDEKGNPLLGAILRVKGNKKFAVTNENGRFILLDVNNGDVVTVSYIGYQTKELTIGDSDNITISMTLAESKLEEVSVVSTGYQNIPKERATGSFKVINNEQLDRPATTLAQRLVGTISGMSAVVDADGNTSFRIRGLTTLGTATGSSEPLIVVDGFAIQGSFDNINPNNIASVTILKDAAAASIWGARSANGVIVITTKTGKKGVAFTADVNTFTRIGSKVDLDYVRPMASSAEAVEFEKLVYGKWVPTAVNAGTLAQVGSGTWSQALSQMNEYNLGRISLAQRDAELLRLSGFDNRQQIRDMILDNPISNQVNLNMSGATSRMTNALSLMYETNTTNFKGTDNKKSLINYRTTANVFNWLDFDMGLMLQYQTGNRNGFTLADIQSWSPYDMIANADGSLTRFPYGGYYMPTLDLLVPQSKFPYDFYYNPVREKNARRFSSETINGRIQAGLTAKIIQGLSVSSSVQYENFNTFNRNLSLEDAFTVRSSVNNTATWEWNKNINSNVILNLPKGAQLDQNRSKMKGYTFRNQLNFNRMIGTDHSLNFIAGTEIRSNVSETFTNPTTYGYNDQTLGVIQFPNGPGGSVEGRKITNWFGANQTFAYTNSFTYITDRYFSSFANLGYTFKDKYTVSGSFRTDASNLIASDPSSRYSPFWSIGGSWQASRESFMNNISWLDKLTARLTFGYNGNEDRSTSPLPLITISGTPNANTGATTATISSYGNPTLRWEKTGTLNAGIDFSVFGGKFFGTVEVYNKKGKDLLADIAIPVVNGVSTQKLNNVEMYNRGIDLDLGSSLKINNRINWRGNVTFSYNKNKITKLFRAQYTAGMLAGGGTGAYVEGMNANSLWSYYYAGLSEGNPVFRGPDGTLVNFGQNTIAEARGWMENSGVSVAPYNLGVVNSFDVYDFNLSFIVTGKFGHVFRRSSFNYPFQNGIKTIPNSRLAEVLNGDPSAILTLPANVNDATYKNWGTQYRYLDYLIESANHVRLQEISLSYTIKPALMQKFHLSGLRIYAQGNDLLTITNNKYDEDPEYLLGTLKPRPRFTFGLKLQL